MQENIKPLECTCGGTPTGKGREIRCSSCHRIMMRRTRKEAITQWNERMLEERAIFAHKVSPDDTPKQADLI